MTADAEREEAFKNSSGVGSRFIKMGDKKTIDLVFKIDYVVGFPKNDKVTRQVTHTYLLYIKLK